VEDHHGDFHGHPGAVEAHPGVGCLRKWLLEFRESQNFIRKWL
jgi:hypothetical protein